MAKKHYHGLNDIMIIRGDHGQFFIDDNIGSLAEKVTNIVSNMDSLL